jgi:hypothetical protein
LEVTDISGKVRLTIVAVVALALFLGASAFLNARDAGSDGPGKEATAVIVFDGDGCHLVPLSCLGPSAVSSPWLAPAQQSDVAEPFVYRAIGPLDGSSPPEAFVLIHTPPPQAS